MNKQKVKMTEKLEKVMGCGQKCREQMQSKGTHPYVLRLKPYKVGLRTRILNASNVINFILIND